MTAEVLSTSPSIAVSWQVHESTVRVEERAPGLSRDRIVGRLQLVLAVRRQARIQNVVR